MGLQREFLKISKVNGLIKAGMQSPSTRPNHPDLGEENSKIQVNREIRECDCCEGRCNTCCPHCHKKDTPPTRGSFCPSEGNMQIFNGRANKNLDGLPMSLGQIQHEQIRQQWPRVIAEKDHLCYNRGQEQCTNQKSVGHAKARITGIADMVNGEFQGHYAPLDTDQQINSAKGQQVKGETKVQSITPIHVRPTLQARELTDPNYGPHYLTQIFQQVNTHNPNAYSDSRLPQQITHHKDLLATIS